MQQKIDEEPFKLSPKLMLEILLKLSRFWMHYRLHPETLDPFIESFKGQGIPEKNLSNVKMMLISLRETHLDNKAMYRVDRYLVSGMGAVDLVLLSVVIPMGTPDPLLFITLLSLTISLLLVATSLFVSFVKSDLDITSYGTVHNTLIFLSLVTGFAAMATLLLHTSHPIGIVFICLVQTHER